MLLWGLAALKGIEKVSTGKADSRAAWGAERAMTAWKSGVAAEGSMREDADGLDL